MVSKDFLDSKEYLTKRAGLQQEINRSCYKPKDRSAEKWRKTPEEMLVLATKKLNHRNEVRRAGFDPNTRLNVTEPIYGKVW